MDIKDQPLVSIIVPCYNHEKFITKCIESVINQTYKEWELIVIDDGSTDNSRDLLIKLKAKFNFALIIQKNIGLPATLNKGIKEFSNGKYITFCASDDYWCHNKLELQVEYMENNPDIPMCFGKSYIIDEKGDINEKLTKDTNHKLHGGEIFKDIILVNFHPPVNYLFKKDIFNQVGYYKEGIWTEDFNMNLRISRYYRIGFIDEFLFYYRLINSGSKIRSLKIINSQLICINEYKDSEYYREALINWHYRNFLYLASCREHKVLSLKGLYYSRRYFLRYSYWFALIKLLLLWR
jgi:alpha-1,3-rhamnosyltransferase